MVPPLGDRRAGRRWRKWRGPAPAPSCSATRRRIADICLVPQLYNARRFSVPITDLSRPCAAPTRRPAPTRPSPPPTPTARSNEHEPRRHHQPRNGRRPSRSAEVEIPSMKGKVSDEEWAIRVDLAAAYRLVAHYGWDDLIFTHLVGAHPRARASFPAQPLSADVRGSDRLVRWSRSTSTAIRSNRRRSSPTRPASPSIRRCTWRARMPMR